MSDFVLADVLAEYLHRIARALERQVSQHDETVSRGAKLRAENLARDDADLAEALRVNEELMQRLDRALFGLDNLNKAWRALEARITALEAK